MREPATDPGRDVILAALAESYAGPAWHGPSVLDALEGVRADAAFHKPATNRNSIWELVLHLAHGRHLLTARTMNGEIDAFPRAIREPWWPVSPERPDTAAWKSDLALLDETQTRLLRAIRDATPEQLARVPSDSEHSIARQLLGMALHDTYHAGQIRMLALLAAG
ncbi:MAG TPA: DinB family protein [Gemmatimonadaceae bacterium]|nr:DinB family protein [Gemmatimonadaceae bacterium]